MMGSCCRTCPYATGSMTGVTPERRKPDWVGKREERYGQDKRQLSVNHQLLVLASSTEIAANTHSPAVTAMLFDPAALPQDKRAVALPLPYLVT